MSSPAVVIVGAGAAGISAARHLKSLRVQTLVLEASARIGGRAVTDNSNFGQPFDRGAHWFHSPAENPLRELADQLQFDYSRTPLAEDYCRASAPLSAAEAQSCAETVERGFDRIAELGARGLDVAAESAIERDARWADVLAAEFTAKQGVSPAQGSSLDYSRYVWRDADLPVTGGYGNLISRLAQGLPVELATPVTAIDRGSAEGVTVHTARGPIGARAVIVTASTGVLASAASFFAGAAACDRVRDPCVTDGSQQQVRAVFHAAGIRRSAAQPVVSRRPAVCVAGAPAAAGRCRTRGGDF